MLGSDDETDDNDFAMPGLPNDAFGGPGKQAFDGRGGDAVPDDNERKGADSIEFLVCRLDHNETNCFICLGFVSQCLCLGELLFMALENAFGIL